MSGRNKISSLNKAARGKRSLTPLCYQIQLGRRRKLFLLYEAVAFDKNDYNRRLIYFERQLPSSFVYRRFQTVTAHFISFTLLESLGLLAWTIWISWLTLTCLLCFTFLNGIKKKGAGCEFLRRTLFRRLDCNRPRAWRIQILFFFRLKFVFLQKFKLCHGMRNSKIYNGWQVLIVKTVLTH